jgi:hypothetical protein
VVRVVESAPAGAKFYAHLDICEQCERNPFDLCVVGAILLQRAGEEDATDSVRLLKAEG